MGVVLIILFSFKTFDYPSIASESQPETGDAQAEPPQTPPSKTQRLIFSHKNGCDHEGWLLKPATAEPYCHNDHEFAHLKFYNDSEFLGGSDLMYVQSRAKVPMKDDSVGSILDHVGQCLKRCDANETHFAAMYDIRKYELPGPSGAYARAKQLVKWCDLMDGLIDKQLHSVAIIIPSGFGAKLLKNCVQFIIWACQPPMDPRLFEDKNGQGLGEAMDFLRTRCDKYNGGELKICKPLVKGQTFSNPPEAKLVEKYKKEVEEAKAKKQ
ncbi:hypothetical protein TL16_g07502 [Triparma laevis f. inornata]|uniref:Macro domain-containing protein n=1 Tax=Triparma laevis f. inornata TaxID=1714386 RepID=A0A9W7AR75_9STRA|nr:hypothetical protein TL16_g07502 [Triparma laevis f. inornata]